MFIPVAFRLNILAVVHVYGITVDLSPKHRPHTLPQLRQSGLKSEGLWIRVKKSIFHCTFLENFDFFRKFTKKFDFTDKFLKSLIVLGNFTKQIRFSEKIPNYLFSLKNFQLFRQNWLITATSGQIILFLFKTYHFPTYSVLPVHVKT